MIVSCTVDVSGESGGDCNQRRLIVECWLDLIVDVHDPDEESDEVDRDCNQRHSVQRTSFS